MQGKCNTVKIIVLNAVNRVQLFCLILFTYNLAKYFCQDEWIVNYFYLCNSPNETKDFKVLLLGGDIKSRGI